jgi:hypothetical protein
MIRSSGSRKYFWIGVSILALAATNLLVTLALLFFEYGGTLEGFGEGATTTRPLLLTALFYIFAPLIAVPTRMGWPIPGGDRVIFINALLWAGALYFLILRVALWATGEEARAPARPKTNR